MVVFLMNFSVVLIEFFRDWMGDWMGDRLGPGTIAP
jgi:hypothetical protein